MVHTLFFPNHMCNVQTGVLKSSTTRLRLMSDLTTSNSYFIKLGEPVFSENMCKLFCLLNFSLMNVK